MATEKTLPAVVPLALLLATAALAGGCARRDELVVFHAASLSRLFGDLGSSLAQASPPLPLRLEPSGSLVAARKVSEQRLRADVVAVADDTILEALLVPRFARRAVVFATNELVLAHLAHSQGTEAVSPETWADVVTRPAVRLGRVDPSLAPLGYHTLLAWQLAEAGLARAGLAAALQARVAPEHVTQDETELLGLLEGRAVDYAFLYRSTAEDHRLKVTPLPDAYNLSRTELAEAYGHAEVRVRMRTGEPERALRGRPITYALAVPDDAPRPKDAGRFVELLRSAEGRRALERHGFRPVPAEAVRR